MDRNILNLDLDPEFGFSSDPDPRVMLLILRE